MGSGMGGIDKNGREVVVGWKEYWRKGSFVSKTLPMNLVATFAVTSLRLD